MRHAQRIKQSNQVRIGARVEYQEARVHPKHVPAVFNVDRVGVPTQSGRRFKQRDGMAPRKTMRRSQA